MVSATANPRLWRVEVNLIHSETSRTAIVCYAYLVEAGLKLYYAYHTVYARPVPSGPWDRGTRIKQGLTPALKSVIHAGFMQEVWSLATIQDVEEFPADPDVPIQEVNLGI